VAVIHFRKQVFMRSLRSCSLCGTTVRVHLYVIAVLDKHTQSICKRVVVSIFRKLLLFRGCLLQMQSSWARSAAVQPSPT